MSGGAVNSNLERAGARSGSPEEGPEPGMITHLEMMPSEHPLHDPPPGNLNRGIMYSTLHQCLKEKKGGGWQKVVVSLLITHAHGASGCVCHIPLRMRDVTKVRPVQQICILGFPQERSLPWVAHTTN